MTHHREALVLLPGLLCDERLFAPQREALLGRVTADVRVPDLTRDESVAAMADRVLAEAPDRFALAGLSMGGYVALDIVRRAPERVARLALLDTQARPDGDEAKNRRRGLMELAERDGLGAATAKLMPLLLHEGRLGDAGLTATVGAMAQAVGLEAFLRQQQAIMGRPDSRPSLPAIAVPTLVLAGREDAITPPDLQHEMAAAIPRATLVLLPHCGHLSTLERPDAVGRQLLAWIEAA